MLVRVLKCSEIKNGSAAAVVSYRDNPSKVVMRGLYPNTNYLGFVDVELGWDKVLSWKLDEHFAGEYPSIWSAKDGIHMRGEVSVFVMNDGTVFGEIRDNEHLLFDFRPSDVGGEPFATGNGIELIVNELYVCPTHT